MSDISLNSFFNHLKDERLVFLFFFIFVGVVVLFALLKWIGASVSIKTRNVNFILGKAKKEHKEKAWQLVNQFEYLLRNFLIENLRMIEVEKEDIKKQVIHMVVDKIKISLFKKLESVFELPESQRAVEIDIIKGMISQELLSEISRRFHQSLSKEEIEKAYSVFKVILDQV